MVVLHYVKHRWARSRGSPKTKESPQSTPPRRQADFYRAEDRHKAVGAATKVSRDGVSGAERCSFATPQGAQARPI